MSAGENSSRLGATPLLRMFQSSEPAFANMTSSGTSGVGSRSSIGTNTSIVGTA